jgi:YesN/AraC family two-component response regulator
MITDILMPEMDGLELISLVLNNYPALKIILISGGGRQLEEGAEIDCLETTIRKLGVEDVLTKPFNPAELINIVDRLLDTG